MFNFLFNFCRQTTIIICFAALFSPALFADQKPYAPETIQGITIVSAEQVIELILSNPDLVVIDSRKKTEYQKGHIEGAINILNTQLKPEDLEQLLAGKSSTVLFYCNGLRCLRSTDSIKKAKNWGYTKVIWFRGGWKEWTKKRLPVVTD
jgi:rhodanese-related sulfurtransferase